MPNVALVIVTPPVVLAFVLVWPVLVFSSRLFRHPIRPSVSIALVGVLGLAAFLVVVVLARVVIA